MDFNKTETAILTEARRNPGNLVGVDFGVQARRAFGTRRHNAFLSLMRKGLLVRLSGSNAPLYKPGYGINGRVFTSVWRLTEGK